LYHVVAVAKEHIKLILASSVCDGELEQGLMILLDNSTLITAKMYANPFKKATLQQRTPPT
jgi:hypothetical protein